MNKWDSINLGENEKPRLSYKDKSSLNDQLKPVFDSIVSSKRGVGTLSNGGLPGPFNGWMYTDAKLASALDTIGIAIRENTTKVPEMMKQISICCIAVHYKANVEYWAHSRLAKINGVPNEVLESMLNEQYPLFDDSEEGCKQEIAYRFTQEFLQSHGVSDFLYNETLDIIGSEQGMVEFICVIGHYTGLVAQLNILKVPNPGDKQIFEH